MKESAFFPDWTKLPELVKLVDDGRNYFWTSAEEASTYLSDEIRIGKVAPGVSS